MRLSEAMRIGASWSKQCFGPVKHTDGRTCAMGSVLETLRGEIPASNFITVGQAEDLRSAFPIHDAFISCPKMFCSHTMSMLRLVVHVNDKHHWTRGEIADWIEIVELEGGWHDQSTVNDESKKMETSTVTQGV